MLSRAKIESIYVAAVSGACVMCISSMAGGPAAMLCRASRLARLNDRRVAENVRGRPFIASLHSFLHRRRQTPIFLREHVLFYPSLFLSALKQMRRAT